MFVLFCRDQLKIEANRATDTCRFATVNALQKFRKSSKSVIFVCLKRRELLYLTLYPGLNIWVVLNWVTWSLYARVFSEQINRLMLLCGNV